MKRFFKIMIMGAGMLSGLIPQIAKSTTTNVIIEREVKNDIQQLRTTVNKVLIGGLPLITERSYGNYGLTPKEYGMIYGNGASKKGKVNRKHLSRMLKLKKSKG